MASWASDSEYTPIFKDSEILVSLILFFYFLSLQTSEQQKYQYIIQNIVKINILNNILNNENTFPFAYMHSFDIAYSAL